MYVHGSSNRQTCEEDERTTLAKQDILRRSLPVPRTETRRAFAILVSRIAVLMKCEKGLI